MCWPCLPAAQQSPEPPKQLEPVKTTVTVVEKISAETPSNVTVVDSTELQATPGTDLDDRLRQTAGFSLFRRTSSVVANPTTQGISLRGIGSSGASRTLVLWDGIPANDPFGGWVYWTQFVPLEMERVEISRGAGTSVFGDRAMSGSIGIFSREPQPLHLIGAFDAGNRDTQDATAGFSYVWPNLAISGDGRAFTTDGYYIVPDTIRGPIDRPAGVRFVTGDVHVDHYTSLGNLFFKFNILAEDRQNGTSLTHNSTSLGTVSLHYDRETGSNSISILGYYTGEGFHSSFSSVPASRRTETLTYVQTVPSNAGGGAVLWRHHRTRWNLMAGGDAARVHGTSTDHLVPTGLRVGGGTQVERGAFAQADGTVGPARLYAGVRESLTGHSHFLSPSAGVTAGAKSLRARASVYRAFRSPTLNELYREFRVGNTDTQANPNLVPETLWGAEAGVDWIGGSSSARVTAYRNSLDHLITNVTLSTAPNLIVRQRQNAAAAVSRGVEAELRRRYRNWTGALDYLFVDSRYVTGFRVAQIPKHQGSAALTYHRGSTLASLSVRSFDYQFDDDANQFRLPGYATVQLMASQRLVKSLSAEAAVENALDHTFYVAFTPTPNTGAPRLWRIGLRWDGKLR